MPIDDVALPGFEGYGDIVGLPLPGGVVVRPTQRYPRRARETGHGACHDCIDITVEQAYGFRTDAPPYALPAIARERHAYWDPTKRQSVTTTRKVCRAHERAREGVLEPTTKET